MIVSIQNLYRYNFIKQDGIIVVAENSKSTMGDFIGYGVSIGSIMGTIIGVLLENPGTGFVVGMITGFLFGFFLGRRKEYDSIEIERIPPPK